VSQLFIELYLDEDVSVLIAELLRARGFSAETALDADQLHKSDEEQLAYAANQSKTLLTHNKADFERLAQIYFEMGREHCGIILAQRRDPYEITQRLLRILDQVTADEMRNMVRYI
jgi:predicted nuclease of predicted toxin-antitoxin system